MGQTWVYMNLFGYLKYYCATQVASLDFFHIGPMMKSPPSPRFQSPKNVSTDGGKEPNTVTEVSMSIISALTLDSKTKLARDV
jgi:hypothetical protein